jgi:DNA-binding transcriptional LysR family regulator
MAGRVALSTPPALGRRLLAPILGAFCTANPEVRLDWSLGARRVDLIGEEVDVAVRFGPLDPTWERVRRLLRGEHHLYAAPGVAEGRALPGALASLPCLGFHATHLRDRWPFRVDGDVTWIQVKPLHWTDDIEALIGLAVAGVGVTMLPDLLVTWEVDRGQLVRLTNEGASLPAEVFANLGAQRPTARARALVDFLADALTPSTRAVRPGPNGTPPAAPRGPESS